MRRIIAGLFLSHISLSLFAQTPSYKPEGAKNCRWHKEKVAWLCNSPENNSTYYYYQDGTICNWDNTMNAWYCYLPKQNVSYYYYPDGTYYYPDGSRDGYGWWWNGSRWWRGGGAYGGYRGGYHHANRHRDNRDWKTGRDVKEMSKQPGKRLFGQH